MYFLVEIQCPFKLCLTFKRVYPQYKYFFPQILENRSAGKQYIYHKDNKNFITFPVNSLLSMKMELLDSSVTKWEVDTELVEVDD